MKYYQEITLIDSSEIPIFQLWSKFYKQLHLALVEQAKATYGDGAVHGDIGVSFPEFKYFEKNGKTISFLGSKLRIFACTKEELDKNPIVDKLEEYNLTDYVHIKSIKPVPEEVTYVTVSRVRQVKNKDRFAKRYAKRNGISLKEAKSAIIERYAEKHDIPREQAVKDYETPTLESYPYITIQSLNGGQSFALEIKQTHRNQAKAGSFSTYGLSSTTTVPDWN